MKLRKMSAENWPEIELAEKENRRELVLSGAVISERIERLRDVDSKLYTLSKLNFLEIGKTCLHIISPKISGLENMTNLILQGNKLTEIPSTINQLKKLKIFDISHNELEELPSEIGEIPELHSLFAGSNKLTDFPTISGLRNLHELEISHNKLTSLPDGINSPKLALLNKVSAAANEITELPQELHNLPVLKTLDVSENRLTAIPSDISQCHKLHAFNYAGNKLNDKKLAKMMDQCSTRAVLDYLRKIYDKEHAQEGGKGKGKRKKKGKGKKDEEEDLCKNLMKVLHFKETSCEVKITPRVADVRPHIVCCIVRNLDLQKTRNMFKNFISLQTRLHDTVCQKRQAATIATHDLGMVKAPLLYDAQRPDLIQLVPLFKNKPTTAEKLVGKLRQEAEEYRKEKKRNTLSGIHKYLDLLKGKQLYPCLIDADGDIVSFPPITNCDKTKISAETTDILIEVTSSTNLDTCKKVMETTLQGMLEMGLAQPDTKGQTAQDSDDDGITFGEAASGEGAAPAGVHNLVLEQVRILDEEGIMKVVYPARNDLLSDAFRVIRDYD